MNYSQSDLNDFISMLASLKQTIVSKRKTHPYKKNCIVSRIKLTKRGERYISLFPDNNSLLLGLSENDGNFAYDEIYGIINNI